MTKNIIENLKNYLEKPSFNNSIVLNRSNTISFHWSNHKVSKNIVTKYFQNLDFNSKNFWIKNESCIVKMNTEDILDFITSNASKKDLIDFIFELKDISFTSAAGPFESRTLSECFDNNDLKAKFLMSVLKNKSPQRSFRLNVNDEVLMCFGENFMKETKIDVHQFSKNGILFKSQNPDIMEKLEDNNEFKFYINSSAPYEEKSLYSESEKDAFKVSKDSIKLSSSFSYQQSDVYFFINYKDMSNKSIKSNFTKYLAQAEELIIKAAS